LVFLQVLPGSGADIGVVSLEGEPKADPLIQTEFSEDHGAISPDGRWIAYDSNLSGPFEIYVQRFPELGDRQRISTGGGRNPLRSPDGRELFYLSLDWLEELKRQLPTRN
jgi:serine/threonine-protein kinase